MATIAENKFTRENVKKQYLEMRVDFLDEEELDIELELRNITFGEDFSMSRKRRMVRDAMKLEREQGGGEQALIYEAEHEIEICKAKLEAFEKSVLIGSSVAPKSNSVLLHVANRLTLVIESTISGITREQADDLLTRTLEYLNRYFGNIIREGGDPGETVTSTNNGTELGGDKTTTTKGNGSQNGNSRPVSDIEQEIVGYFHRLGIIDSVSKTVDFRTSLSNLESELNMLRKFRAEHETQLANRGANSSLSVTSNPNTSITTGQTMPILCPNSTTIAAISTSNSVLYTGTIPKSSYTNITNTTVISQYSRPITTPVIQSNLRLPVTMPCNFNLQTNRSTLDNPLVGFPQYNNPIGSNRVSEQASLIPWIPASVQCSFNSMQRNNYLYASNRPVEHINFVPQIPSSLPPFEQLVGTDIQDNPVSGHTNFVPPPQTTMGNHGVFPNNNEFLPNNNAFGRQGYSGIPFSDFQSRSTTATTHRTLPVSQWNIEKYSGTDQGTKLNEFLALVGQLSLSERVSEEELFDSAFHLFTGPAANWYMSMRSSYRLRNWQHLVHELRKTFTHPELDSMMRSRIYQRYQQKNETFQNYFFDIEKLLRSMTVQMSDQEKLEIIKRNLRTDYKKALLWKSIHTLPDLIEAGHLIDASNFSLYHTVFGNQKSANVIDQRNPPPSRNEKWKPRQEQYRDNARKQSNTKPEPRNQVGQPSNKQIEVEKNPTSSKRPNVDNPQEGSSRPRRTIDFLVAGFNPPAPDVCLNCRLPSHQVEQCRSLKGLICFICGFKGFDTQNCPYCRKNGQTMSENRRSSTKLA